MDSAEEAEQRRALSQQSMLLGRQQEELEASRRAYSHVSLQLNRLVEHMDWLQVSLPAVRGETPAHGPEGTVHRHRTEHLGHNKRSNKFGSQFTCGKSEVNVLGDNQTF